MIPKKNKAAKTIQKAYKKHKQIQPILKFLQSKKFKNEFDYFLEEYLTEYDTDIYLNVEHIVKAITSKDKKFKIKMIKLIEGLVDTTVDELLSDVLREKFPKLKYCGFQELIDMIKGKFIPEYE